MLNLTEKNKLLKEIPFKTVILEENANNYLNNWIEFTKSNRVLGGALRRLEGDYKFSKRTIIVFEKENGDFNIIDKVRTWYISINNKIYSSEKINKNISYKKDKNQLWQINGNRVEPYTNFLFKSERDSIKLYLIEKIGTILCNFNSCPECITYNYCFKNKLTNYKKYVAHKYKGLTCKEAEHLNFLKGIIAIKQNLLHLYRDLSYLNKEMFLFDGNPYIKDLITMSYQLQYPISFKWSERRIKEEHDKLSKKITEAMSLSAKKEDLNLEKVYFELETFLNKDESDNLFTLLRTNIDLITEGTLKKHCVAIYIDKVNTKNRLYSFAIFRYLNYTLEIGRNQKIFTLKQCRGFRNEDSSVELKKYIQNKLDLFSSLNNYEESLLNTATKTHIQILTDAGF